MKTNTARILSVMHIVSWVAFIGLLIKAGAILVSYIIALDNPENTKRLATGLDLYNLQQFSFWQYTGTISFLVAINLMKAYVAYLVIIVLSTIKITAPFTMRIAQLLEKISTVILGTWVVAMLFNLHTDWLMKRVADLQPQQVGGEFILLAGVVFVISQVFKKGVELQTENALTV